MFAFATTAEVLTGATTFVPACVLACALHAGVGDRAPGNEQDHPDDDQYERLPFHRTFPLSTGAQQPEAEVRCAIPLAALRVRRERRGRT